MGADHGFAASGLEKGVLAGRAKEMKMVRCACQEALTMLIGGIEFKQTRRKDWYRKNSGSWSRKI
jgi:hypothetical protein